MKLGAVIAGKYVLRERIAAGGMGVVYLADQPALARSVAIKLLQPALAKNPDHSRRLRDEAVFASRVQHPSCVAMIDCGLLPCGRPFVVMEYVRGRPLSRLVAEGCPPVTRSLALVQQLLGALDAAHTSGVVHADVKTDNLLVQEIDGTDHVTLIDFGLARIDGVAHRNADEPISGTPEYMAPEVILGADPTPASDLYGAGIVLYELLTGATPFTGDDSSTILERHLREVVIPPSLRRPDRDISTALDQVVLRALAKDPSVRFQTAQELADALTTVARETDVLAMRRCRHCGVRVASAARYCSHCGIPFEAARSHPSPDSPTRELGPARQRLAHGSECNLVATLRNSIADALIRGDVSQLAADYLVLASSFARVRRFADAVHELEEGIDLLSGGRGPSAPGEPVARLVVALAALGRNRG